MYVVRRPEGRWEIRSSSSTAKGPRSRTLATFRELDAEATAKVCKRGAVDAETVRALCRRAGAPVAPRPVDGAAAQLLAASTREGPPRPALIRVLGDAIGLHSASDSERAAIRWIDASATQRGETLRDLLLLADRLPARDRGPLEFPTMHFAR